MLPPGCDVDLLLIGKTGHGKSSTGNSILGREEEFQTSEDMISETCCSKTAWAEIDGRVIKVVDTPGVLDTRLDTDASRDQVITAISDAIASCPQGFHALLLVVSFTARMTEEEKKAIRMLKTIMGERIVRDHAILVVTYGDLFSVSKKAKTMSFLSWCKSQKGFFKDLFTECQERCVLFHNNSEDRTIRERQRTELITKVDSMKQHGTRYTNNLFELAQREWQRIIEEQKMKAVEEELMKNIHLLLVIFNNMSEKHPKKDNLTRLKEKVDKLRQEINEKNSDQLQELLRMASELAAAIDSKLIALDQPDINSRTTENQNNGDFEQCHADLQNYYDKEMTPKDKELKTEVANKVKEEVEKSGGCFPGSSTVTLASGKCILLEDLQVGDRVVVRDGKRNLSTDVIYMFGHKDPQALSEFVVLKTATHSVSVTKGHYVYCVQDGKEMCLAAENVQCGDFLLTMSSDELMPQPVMSICYERKQGLFAPFTLCGNIVVDQALMSCYIDVLPASTCHTLLWPVRQLHHLSPRALAFVNGSTSGQPIPGWAKAALGFL